MHKSKGMDKISEPISAKNSEKLVYSETAQSYIDTRTSAGCLQLYPGEWVYSETTGEYIDISLTGPYILEQNDF